MDIIIIYNEIQVWLHKIHVTENYKCRKWVKTGNNKLKKLYFNEIQTDINNKW